MKRKSNISKLLAELDKEDLIAEIEKLCEKFDVVRSYFEIELSGDITPYLERAKKDIYAQLFTSKGGLRKKPKASNLNNIIKDFSVLSIYKEDVATLMVYRIDTTWKYGTMRGGVSTALYNSQKRAINATLELIDKEGLEDKFAGDLVRMRDMLEHMVD